MSIIYKHEIYLSILSLLLLILLLLLFFIYKNYRYIVQREKSSRDPFCHSNDRFQRLVKMRKNLRKNNFPADFINFVIHLRSCPTSQH